MIKQGYETIVDEAQFYNIVKWLQVNFTAWLAQF